MSPIPQVFRRRPLISSLLLILVVIAGVLTLWSVIAMTYTYSSGNRAGFLQKISRKGWVCKTWEGEMQLSSIPGSAPTTFLFTVRSDSVAKVLESLNGRRVVVDYKEHNLVPNSCFGDTHYFVDGVRPVTDSTSR